VIDDLEIRGFLDEGYARLVGAVALVTGSVAMAEDAVQEAVIAAWERSERGDRIENLPAWIATVALNRSRSGVRRVFAERRARGRLTAAPSTGEPTDRVDVRRALAALPRRQREAAVLRYLLDLSTEETADAMGTSVGTVKSQLARARASLAEALAVHDEEPTEVDHADA
jgi:RNA polymerase sigma-70 factor (ECF subfamily)